MSDLNKLYQQIILEHNKNPRNFRRPENANCEAEGYNPLCGDRIHVALCCKDDAIADIGFLGSGCVISRASASLMTEALNGKSIAQAMRAWEAVSNMLHSESSTDLGDLNALSGVRQFPVRIKCAELPWQTLLTALQKATTKAQRH
jgi:nitrogen fixation NifU-like protein